MADMTITELAEHVGMTPRNIRAYQSRGLLDPPVIRGRVARYSGVHTARLLLIGSLQREGFTLEAIKRLLKTPSSYAAIVADRRRHFRDGDADMPATVPVSEERIRTLFPMAPDDLTDTGLVWKHEDGSLVSHAVVVGVGRTLLGLGLPAEVVAMLQLEAVRGGREVGGALREHLDGRRRSAGGRDAPGGPHGADDSDLAKIAVQLSATAFELAFLEAATGGAATPAAGEHESEGPGAAASGGAASG